ncbi:MAG TPA: response regulator [Clostridiaceae bacterium]|nr:response regulator [Clostridiaceae bacterium]
MIKTLIVEDEGWVRKGIIKVIKWEELGMKLIGEAQNGEEALHIMALEKPDLIITDMKMPKYSGIDFLKELEHVRPDCEIIVISGYSDYEYMKQAISSGVFEYILKPIDEDDLNEVLKRVLKKIDTKRKEQENKKLIEAKLDASLPLLEENVLNSLISGVFDKYDDLLEKVGNINIDLNYKCFSVMSIFIKDMYNLGRGYVDLNEDGFLQVYNDIKQIVRQYQNYNVFKNMQSIYEVIILCKGDEQDYKKIIAEQIKLADEIINTVQNKHGINLRIGIGDWKKGFNNIRHAYEEAKKALKFEKIGGKDIIFYSGIKNFKDQKEDLYYIEEKQLSSILQNSGKDEAVRLVKSLFENVNKMQYCKISSLRKAIIDLMLIFERSCRKLSTDFNTNLFDEENYIDIIEKLSSISGLERWTLDTIQRILNNLNDRRQKESIDIIQDIKNYIEANYHEDINLIQLSQKYYMNHIYLSRLFKSQTGENFIDYLTRIRMLKAKELLEKGTFKIKVVSELVGYSNPYYFTKSFKKFFGYPPSEVH